MLYNIFVREKKNENLCFLKKNIYLSEFIFPEQGKVNKCKKNSNLFINMKSSILKRRLGRLAGSACAALFVGSVFTACEDDLLTGTPSWLGSSIYDELQERGTFTQTLSLINDAVLAEEDYPSMLKRTGSKTLFVADDNAWNRFWQNNPYGARSLADLTGAQKKLLFKSAMINNAYLIELMSNIPGDPPSKGNCMRRASGISIYDSVPRMMPADMPETRYWDKYRAKPEGILIMKDNSATPMVHFLPAYMRSNNITADDYRILTNGAVSDIDRSYINGKKVTEENITCQNGYIHVLEDVPTPLDNMAGIIGNKSQFALFNKLMNRYCRPVYSASISSEYNRIYNNGTGVQDSVFVLGYFNDAPNSLLDTDEDGNEVGAVLSYDPCWNCYIVYNQEGITMSMDAGAMLVPTDKALNEYFEGAGKALKDRYQTWDNVPDNVLEPLISNQMLNSFRTSVPSKFASVSNSQNELMGLTVDDVDSCFVGCNGVVYQVNRVFIAPEYQSVFFPVMVREDEENGLGVMYRTVKNILPEYEAYLLSMGSQYSYIVPSDHAMLNYIDPVSYGKTQKTIWRISKDETNGQALRVVAYRYDMETGEIGAQLPNSQQPTTSQIRNRLRDIMDNHIVVGLFNNEQTYYTNKAGGPVVVRHEDDGKVSLAGSYQAEKGDFFRVDSIYDMTNGGNGRTYVVEDAPLMTTMQSPYKVLQQNPEYEEFFNLLSESSFMATVVDGHATMDNAVNFFNNFHYTIYVPTNETIRELINDKKLPTWADVESVKEDENLPKEESDSLVADLTYKIESFLRYHIQDNALYLGGQSISDGLYETAALDTTINRFRRLTVNYTSGGQMTVKDACGNVRRVNPENSNKLSRQYLFNTGNLNTASEIYSSSYAVIHQIDAPLFYATDQFAVQQRKKQKISKP